ncbi:putative DD41D transposase [Trichonephila clavipes]|nr:putative DD41D transposase [Trichonephila clavipes]
MRFTGNRSHNFESFSSHEDDTQVGTQIFKLPHDANVRVCDILGGGLLSMDHENLNNGQVTWMAPEMGSCKRRRMFGLAIHQNDHQAKRRFVEWAQNEIAVVPDFHKRILFSDEAHFWLNGYVNKQNCRIWSEANPQVYVETPFHPEKLTVWCALWAGGILLQKR